MKQVININFQGRVVPIEVTAFDLLKDYTESLSRHFANEEGKDEIINDIESRIGELFQERLNKGATCITDDDVNAIIKSMGRPEEFEAEDGMGAAQPNTSEESGEKEQPKETTQRSKRLYRDENNKILGGVCSGIANYFGIDSIVVRILFVVTGIGFFAYILLWAFLPSGGTEVIGGKRKKLYRDNDDKIIGGVCGGIGNYFGINAWIPRVLFALPFLSYVFRWGHWGFLDFPDFLRIGFSPGALIIYIILWLVIPEAVTTAEKLEMKGEKVDLNSIKHSVMEEMKGVQQRAQKFGKEAGAVAGEKAKLVTSEANKIAKRSSSSFGDIIVLMLKIFAYCVIGFVGLMLLIALFVLLVFSIGYFPLKDFIIHNDYQNLFAWGTLIFFLAVPLIGAITWIIRKIARSKSNSNILGWSFGAMWVIGWICVTLLVSSIARDFNYNSKNITEHEIALSNPAVDKLEITAQSPLQKYNSRRFFRFEPFESIYDDTAYVNNVEVRIVKSLTDSFKVTMIKMATGRSRTIAENNAADIMYNAVQKDSVLLMDKGIAINKTDKFRNQRVVLTVYVPAGKKIKIDKSISWFGNVHFGNNWAVDDWYYDSDDQASDWKTGVEYIMKADGRLYDMNDRPASRKSSGRTKININSQGVEVITNDHSNDNYRYSDGEPMNKVDSLELKLNKEKQKMKDSLEKVKEKIEQQLEKIGDNEEPTPLSSRLPVYSPMMNIN